jgi:hypothetical protein
MFWLNAADVLTHAHKRAKPEVAAAEHRSEMAV